MGLFGALSGLGLSSELVGTSFGQAGGWCEHWDYRPGSVSGILARIGRSVGRSVPGRRLKPGVRLMARFLGSSEDFALGAAFVVCVSSLFALRIGLMVLPLLGLGWYGLRSAELGRALAQKRSWETHVVELLRRAHLNVVAGRNLRQAFEAAGDQGVEGAAAEITSELDARWRAGQDTASVLQAVGKAAPDFSTMAFFHRLARAYVTGGQTAAVLANEISRMRAARRARLGDQIENLPLRLGIFKTTMMIAGFSVFLAMGMALVEDMMRQF